MKAVIMNSADKLADDGSHSFNGNIIAPGSLLGMEKTVRKMNNDTWLQSAAFDDFRIDSMLGTLEGGFTALDEEMGAGHLNAKRAFQQLAPGQYGEGLVPLIGWDYGQTTGTNDLAKYQLNQPLQAGDFISVTLAWDRVVNFANDANSNSDFDSGDTFEEYMVDSPNADDVTNGMGIFLVPSGSFSTNQAVALASTLDGTVEHLFFPIQQSGNYEIWIRQFDDDVGNQEYGLAWWYGLSPPVSSFFVSSDFDGDGNITLADLSQWQGDYGINGDSDANEDGVSDGLDFLAWQRDFSNSAAIAASKAVPEPSTALLAIFASCLFGRGLKYSW